MHKRFIKLLTVCLCSIPLLLSMVSPLQAEGDVALTHTDVFNAYCRFRDTAVSQNKPLSNFTYDGHEYIVTVSDYYQVYTNKAGDDAVIICSYTYDKQTYVAKFSVSSDYYPGLDSVLESLKYVQASFPECFTADYNTPGVTEPTTTPSNEPEQPKIGVSIDLDGDGLIDDFVEPDGVTAYMPDQFVNRDDFNAYVVQHLSLYKDYIYDNGFEIFWKETNEHVGYVIGNGVDED